MDRTNEINHMLDTYGEYWILRDLDYLPEKISGLCRSNEMYLTAWRQLSKMTEDKRWSGFKTEREALMASKDVRRTLGLNPSECIDHCLDKINGEMNMEIKKFKENMKNKYGTDIQLF